MANSVKPVNSVRVDIESDGVIIETFFIDRATVAQAARRFKLTATVMESDLTDHEKNQMLNCCALAPVLRDKDGQLLYPDDNTAVSKMYNEMHYYVCQALITEYMQINPVISDSLGTKKKKS